MVDNVLVTAARLKSPRGEFTSRDHKIISCVIISSTGQTTDVRDIIVELNVYQDIYSSVINGNMTLIDNVDIINKMAFCGNEYIFLEITQPNSDSRLSKYFRIYNIQDRQQKNNSGQSYTLNFCSDQQIISESQKISKAYIGKKTSDIVEDIATNYLKISPNNLDIEQTIGVYDIVIPYFRPIEAIQFAASRSLGGNKSNYCYFFFETRNEFRFRSLQSLYESAPIKTISFGSKNAFLQSSIDNALNQDTIDRFNIENDHNLLYSISSGAYSASLLGIDLYNQSTTLHKRSLSDSVDKLLNKNLPINEFKERTGTNLLSSYNSLIMMYNEVKNRLSERDNDIELLLDRAQFLSALNSFKMRIVIPADISLNVGDLIEVEFPEFSSYVDNSKQINKFRTGKYLITAISYKIVGDNFTNILEICSDSPAAAFPAATDIISKIDSQLS